MTNAFSKPSQGTNKVAERIQHHVRSFPPPISFIKSKRAKEKKESSDYREFEMKLDPTDNNSQKTKKSAVVFEDGDPEMWCEWRRQIDNLCRLLGIQPADNDFAVKYEKIIVGLLRGKALENFETYKTKQEAVNAARPNNSRWDDVKILKHTLNDMALEIFPSKHSYRRQVFYMKYHLFMGDGITVKAFENRVAWLNQSLKYFPMIRMRNGQFRDCAPLGEDQICDIINIAKKPEWTAKMMEANVDPYDLTLAELIEYLERLKVVDNINKKTQKKKPSDDGKSSKRKRKDEDGESDKKGGRIKPCETCGKRHRGTCWHDKSKATAKDDAKDKRWKPGTGTNKQRVYTLDEISEISHMIFGKPATQPSLKKRKKTTSVSEDEESAHAMFQQMRIRNKNKSNDSSDDESQGYEHCNAIAIDRPTKKQCRSKRCSEIVVRLPGSTSVLRALLDSGTSSSIILRQHVDSAIHGVSSYKAPPTKWKTMGGIYTTRRRAQVCFQLPEFSLRKKVTWTFHVDDTTDPSHAQYDMIIGDDLLQELKLVLDYSTDPPTVKWDQVSVLMKEKGTLNDPEVLNQVYALTLDLSSPAIKAAEERVRILDTDEKTYADTNLRQYVGSLTHLRPQQQERLLSCMQTNPVLFSGGLATADVKPVDFELVPNAKPYHIKQPFSIPVAYRPTTRKEIDRLCSLGVLEERSDSEWACGTFIVPKKTGDVRVVTDFRILNSMLVRRPFPLPKIKDLLQSLSGFTFASAIDLSMGYYSIPLSEQAQELTTFLLPWGKFRYKRLPMGIKTAPDIFQETMQHILGDLPYVQVYIDDVLLLTNGTYEDHCAKLQIVLNRLDKYNFRCRPDTKHITLF